MRQLLNKLLLSPYFFTIALRRKTQKTEISRSLFAADYIVPAKRTRWVADPILVDCENETYLFFEAFYKNKGRLEVARVSEDCSLVDQKVILEEPFHLSYPMVFSMDDDWYMIPETSEVSQVCLYRAVKFPYKWEKQQILLEAKAVDTTVFCVDGTWFLLTFLLTDGSERVTPRAYRMEKGEKIRLCPLTWDEYDGLRCRGAGMVFEENGKMIRPAQVSTDSRYGDKVAFYEPKIDRNNYTEQFCGELTPENVKAQNWWMDGLHTYAVSERFEAIDIRVRKLDLLKIPRVITGRLFKRVK